MPGGFVTVQFDEELADQLARELPGIGSTRGRVQHVAHEFIRQRRGSDVAGGGNQGNGANPGIESNPAVVPAK